MILNISGKPYREFSITQRLACHGETVATHIVTDIEGFEKVYDLFESSVSFVIVNKNNFMLANDVCNYVRCPVVTLDVEQEFASTDVGDCPMGWAFIEYDYDEA